MNRIKEQKRKLEAEKARENTELVGSLFGRIKMLEDSKE
jgi:hypothetical protein